MITAELKSERDYSTVMRMDAAHASALHADVHVRPALGYSPNKEVTKTKKRSYDQKWLRSVVLK